MRRLALVSFVLLAACAGTETGNPPFAPSVGGGGGSPMGVVPTVQLDGAAIALDALVFLPGASCAAGDDGVTVAEGVTLPLIGAGARPATDAVLEEGDHCGARLEGATLTADGATRTGEAIRLRARTIESLDLIAESPFTMSASEGAVIVFLDVSLLFAGVDLSSAERAPDGAIELSTESNVDLLTALSAQISSALALYRDADADGILSDDERRAGPLALGVP